MQTPDLAGHVDLDTPMQQRLAAIFRALAAIRVLIAAAFVGVPLLPAEMPPILRALTISEALFLLIYLSLPRAPRLLGRAYLPIAIIWATVMPLIVQNGTLYLSFEEIMPTEIMQPSLVLLENRLVLGIINQTILVLIVPLIVVGWVYPRRVLIGYCAAICLCDLLMIVLFFQTQVTLFLFAFALIFFRTMLHAVIGVMIHQIVTIQREQQRRLIAANAQLRAYADLREQLATSRERARLARELHDTLAHTLSAATVQLEAVNLIWDQQPEKARALVVKSTSTMRDGLSETRRALHALRAGSLEREDVVQAITVLAESLMTRYPVQIEIAAASRLNIGSVGVEHGVYRIVQEALFNAVRHADAAHIRVQIDGTASSAQIAVIDDGIGFDAARFTTHRERAGELPSDGHYGVRGMIERAAQIGAALQIASQIGRGTTVTLSIAKMGEA